VAFGDGLSGGIVAEGVRLMKSMHAKRTVVCIVCLLASEALAGGWEIVARTIEDTTGCGSDGGMPRVAGGGDVVVQSGSSHGEGPAPRWFRQLPDGTLEQQGAFLPNLYGFPSGYAVDGDICILGQPEYNSEHALVYDLSGSGDLTSVATLEPWGGASDQFFAWSGTISLSGNIAAIGAPYDTPNGYSSGSVWIFERSSGGSWSNLQRLVGASKAYFGRGVCVYGDQMVIVAGGYMYAEDSYVSVYRRGQNGQWTLHTSMTAASICGECRLDGCAISDTAIVLVANYTGERFAARWQTDGTLGSFESFGNSWYSESPNEYIALSNDWMSLSGHMYRLPEEGGFVDAGHLGMTTSVPDASYVREGTIASMGEDRVTAGALFHYPMEGNDSYDCYRHALFVFEWSCDSDVTSDAIVDVADVSVVIDRWGSCPGCDGDVNGDGVIDVLDLLAVLANWGQCG